MGIRVFCPDTKLPSGVFQLKPVLGPTVEAAAFRGICWNLQLSIPGGSMVALGGVATLSVVLVEVGQILLPLTVTL